ncbi:hypothetical protein RFI_37889 [Reticulomyxa filosa]|uniref:Uncharacterized protein n=1 Tax=Reticulomyxa filosa TaxID=46433 RepID=X6LEM6_RETFI|nr:hypothetical protein RFI_37889 [Reticulomyxa filosa]|eukprot:ETN99581.1 hypothetical protein RFI_37889 [Reticulomyxa filosa]
MNDSAPLSALCGLASVRCMTKHHQKSLMSIEFKDVKIRLSHYKLRNYKSCDKEALRFLVFEGSDDGISLIPLRQHADDKALRKDIMAHTRPLEMSQYLTCSGYVGRLLHLKQMFIHKWRLFLLQFQKSSNENIMGLKSTPHGKKKIRVCTFVYVFAYYKNIILFVWIGLEIGTMFRSQKYCFCSFFCLKNKKTFKNQDKGERLEKMKMGDNKFGENNGKKYFKKVGKGIEKEI